MNGNKKIYVCQNCLNQYYNSIKNDELSLPFSSGILNDPDAFKDKCLYCQSTNIIQISITKDEYLSLIKTSHNIDFILAMNKLKTENVIEYYSKLALFKLVPKNNKNEENIPKCPTCGSTNVKKISIGQRYVGVGLVGVASSNMTHTMQCNDCGYKW